MRTRTSSRPRERSERAVHASGPRALYRIIPERVEPGVTTQQLDRFAEDFIRSHEGAEPAFKGLYGFPATLCISVNHEVVHGIPSVRRKPVAICSRSVGSPLKPRRRADGKAACPRTRAAAGPRF